MEGNGNVWDVSISKLNMLGDVHWNNLQLFWSLLAAEEGPCVQTAY